MKRRSYWLGAGAAGALAASAPGQTELYQLQTGSLYELGCHGGCLCPILVHAPMTGTFHLTRLSPDPLYEHFAITDVRWTSSGLNMAGGGTYRVGGEVALQQQMTLDLDIAGTPKHLGSGLVQVQALWPRIVITIDNSAESPACYDTVIHIEAAPLPTHCTADFDNDGNIGTDADIQSFFACLSGNCCATCGSADFNGDGDTGTDADIESFFRVLAGGAC